MLPAAGRGAGLAGLRPPPPTGEDGHALLLAEAAVRAVARLDLLAHAALALDHLQQLPVALAGRRGWQGQRQRQRRVGLETRKTDEGSRTAGPAYHLPQKQHLSTSLAVGGHGTEAQCPRGTLGLSYPEEG